MWLIVRVISLILLVRIIIITIIMIVVMLGIMFRMHVPYIGRWVNKLLIRAMTYYLELIKALISHITIIATSSLLWVIICSLITTHPLLLIIGLHIIFIDLIVVIIMRKFYNQRMIFLTRWHHKYLVARSITLTIKQHNPLTYNLSKCRE